MKFLSNTSASFFIFILLLTGCNTEDNKPVSEEIDPVLQSLEETGILFWDEEQKLVGYRSMAEIAPTRTVLASDNPYPLGHSSNSIDSVVIDGEEFTLNEIMEQLHLAGLIIVSDGEIKTEMYRRENNHQTRWISFSITKSLVSMLYGAAVMDGYIESLDQRITEFMPEFEGTAYEGVNLRQLLTMTTGVSWNEDYNDPDSDVAQLDGAMKEDMIAQLQAQSRVTEPGSSFNYNTGETNLAGFILQRAVGTDLSEYLTNRVWQPYGMETDADWMLIGPDGPEFGGCCLSATLRDYARIGLFALSNGMAPDGNQILPENWMQESTTPGTEESPYGYFWWLLDQNRFAASGIFGQHIHINRDANLVIAMHGYRPDATSREFSQKSMRFFNAVTELLSEE